MKRRIVAFMLIACMLFTLAACGGGSSSGSSSAPAAPAAPAAPSGGGAAAAPTYTWKFASQSNDEVLMAHIAREISDEILKRTNGDFKLEVYTNASLGSDREIAEGVQAGLIDVGQVTYAVLANFCPALGVTGLPYLLPDWDTVFKYMDSEIMDYQAGELEKAGFISLGGLCYGFRQCTNNVRPITKIDDFVGIKFRVMQSDLYIDTFQALGAYPVGMAKAEVITALQQNTIDGQENPMEINYSEGMAEVQKYVSKTSHVSAFMGYVCNPDSYNKLPDEYKQILKDVFNEFRMKASKQYSEEEEMYAQKLVEAGMQYNEVAPEEIAKMRAVCVEKVWPKYQDAYKDQLAIINKL